MPEQRPVEIVIGNGCVETAVGKIIRLTAEWTCIPLNLAAHSGGPRMGIMYANSLMEGCEKGLELLSVGCASVLVVRIEGQVSDPVRWRTNEAAWPEDCPENRTRGLGYSTVAFSDVIANCHRLVTQLATMSENALEWRCGWLRRKLAAVALWTLIQRFSHGGSNDIVNSFIAPARMLCQTHAGQVEDGWIQEAHRLCAEFEDSVIRTITDHGNPHHYGELGADILRAFEPIREWHHHTSSHLADYCGHRDLEYLMHLLTTIRVLAGTQILPVVSAGGREAAKCMAEAHVINDVEERRILVIDDHVGSWKPVLTQVRDVMRASNIAVRIEVASAIPTQENDPQVYDLDHLLSDDAQPLHSLRRSIPEYDLILLDIFFQTREASGLQFLRTLRERRIYVPVVLWTTSMDKDFPAGANMANGFLFKKASTAEEIADALKRWLSEGRSQRLWSLPNPFFDHMIRTPKLREEALSLTKWTLRYMDCFHAIDDKYFRYFNDHGGRHILGVLDVMEKLLRPFLMEPGVLLDEKNSEMDMFRLYAAILFHEYGMFPIRHSESQPDQKAVEAMRKTHALRGMAMVCSNIEGLNLPNSKSYDNVAGLRQRLISIDKAAGEEMTASVAVLIGYHQRFLRLDKHEGRDHFLRFTSEDEEWADLINKQSDGGIIALDPEGIQAALNRVSTQRDSAARERLRKQCALLRFADALDVDATRTPADFILRDANRRPMQNVEDCKRLALLRCSIDRGIVSVGFIGGPPTSDMAGSLMPLCQASIRWHTDSGNSEKDRKAKKSAEEVSQWLEEGRKSTSEVQFLREIGEIVVSLGNAWKDRMAIGGCDGCRQRTPIVRFLEHAVAGYFVKCESIRQENTCVTIDAINSLKKIRPIISAAAAVLVLDEVLDEYKAIVHAGLSDHIQLGVSSPWNAQNADEDPWPFLLDLALDPRR